MRIIPLSAQTCQKDSSIQHVDFLAWLQNFDGSCISKERPHTLFMFPIYLAQHMEAPYQTVGQMQQKRLSVAPGASNEGCSAACDTRQVSLAQEASFCAAP